MNDATLLSHPRRDFVAALIRFIIICAGAGLYCLSVIGSPSASWTARLPKVAIELRGRLYGGVQSLLSWLGLSEWGGSELRDSLYLLLVGCAIPWIVMGLLRRGRPSDIGFRRPNALSWRFILVSLIVASAPLVWLGLQPTLGQYYLPHLRRAGILPFSLYYLCNMFSEHFLLHGVILAAFRPGLRWPTAAGGAASEGSDGFVRPLRWLGFAQSTGEARGVQRVSRWSGLADGCVAGILGSTVLFALVHVGKDPRELVTSIPGGLALAFMAYRTNSWLTPFFLHLLTAGTVCLVMLIVA